MADLGAGRRAGQGASPGQVSWHCLLDFPSGSDFPEQGPDYTHLQTACASRNRTGMHQTLHIPLDNVQLLKNDQGTVVVSHGYPYSEGFPSWKLSSEGMEGGEWSSQRATSDLRL